jgi:hypothetical protein
MKAINLFVALIVIQLFHEIRLKTPVLVGAVGDGYDGYEYAYEDVYEGDVNSAGATEVSHQAAETIPTSVPSEQREKDKKEERRKESMKMQKQLKEKQRQLKEEEDAKAAALAALAHADYERAEFVKTGGGVGYKKNVGRGLKKVLIPMANEQFLNSTALGFHCIPLDAWGLIKRASADGESDEERTERELKDALSRMDGTHKEDDKEEEEKKENKPEKVFDNPKVKAKPKKATFRELQEKKIKERKEKEAKKIAQMGSFPVGSSCEGLVCASCRVLTEEFGNAVVSGVNNPAFTYVEDVLPAFCNRKEVKQRYSDLVGTMCDTIVSTRVGYKEAFLAPFEEESEYTSLSMELSIKDKTRKVCLDMGACNSKQFEVQITSIKPKEKHWDEKCHVCQAFSIELEERLQLQKSISEGETGKIVSSICEKLALPDHLKSVCQSLSSGTLHSDISWIAYMHAESIPRRKLATKLFKDQLCEEMKFCEPFVDEEEAAKEEAKKVEPVFF